MKLKVKELISSVERMIDKEEKHLASLKEKREKLESRFFTLFRSNKELLDFYILKSEIMLEHYKKRLEEYKEKFKKQLN
jgi:hypothetical protein